MINLIETKNLVSYNLVPFILYLRIFVTILFEKSLNHSNAKIKSDLFIIFYESEDFF